MSATLAAAAYAIVGSASPFALAPRLAPVSFLIRAFAVWLLTALILFFVDDQGVVLALAAVVLVVLMPPATVQRIGFFIVAAPCLPAYLQVYLPFPGINWLIIITYYKVVVLVVLVPLLFRGTSRNAPGKGTSMVDTCVALYIAVSVALVTLAMGLTAGPRFLIDQLIVLGVPYYVLSRLVRNQEDLDFCFRAILLASLILAGIAIMATLKQWDFYRLKEPSSVFTIPDTRSGLIRISATANTHSLGYHLALGVLVLEYLKRSLSLGTVRLWLFRGMLLAGIVATDSRGTLLGLAVAMGVYYVITIRKSGVRLALMASLALAVVGVGIWLVTTEDASGVDAYNSVGYRQLLLEISIQHILQHPIIGDLHYLSDPKFAVLRQGQGIIDITNFYLQIGLSFGLVGLMLLAGMLAPTMRGLMRLAAASAPASVPAATRKMSALMLSGLVGWLLLLATTSDVALTFHLGLILIAFGQAAIRFATVGEAAGERRRPDAARPIKLRPVKLRR